MERPSLNQMFMMFAFMIGNRSECRRKVEYAKSGTVITSKDKRQIKGFGYNGRGQGEQEPCPGDATLPGQCGCVHSEANAIANARGDLRGCTLCCTSSPCEVCARLIVNCGIKEVIFYSMYRDKLPIEMLNKMEVTCRISLSISPDSVLNLFNFSSDRMENSGL